MKKAYKDSLTLGKISLTNSVMASAVAGAGGNAAPLNTFATYTPIMANISGAGHTLRMVKSLSGKRQKRRKARR